MDQGAIAEALATLDGQAEFGAHRFDPNGAALAGRAVVLPSAFNPPTVAHLRLLELAAAATGAAHRIALLTSRNVDKGLYGATLGDRIGMLLAARAGGAELAIVATNAARFIDQATALRGAYPAASFDFVAGHDTLVRIFERKYYDAMEAELEPFFAEHRLVVSNRGAVGLAEIERFVAGSAAAFRDRILLAELDPESAAVSSSQARQGVASAGVPTGLPPAVSEYIARNSLYR